MTSHAQFQLFPHASLHVNSSELESFGRQVTRNKELMPYLKGVALAGNTQLSDAQGEIKHGALIRVSADMPLSKARDLAGQTLCGRVGVYELHDTPAHLTTITSTKNHMSTNNVAKEIDNYGEDYAAFSPDLPSGSPWVPRFSTGAPGSRNCVGLMRHSTKAGKFAVIASTNMGDAVHTAIQTALDADASTTVGDFVESPEAARIYAAADLENKRVAHRFAVSMDIDGQLDVCTHPLEMTTQDEFGANVQFARPSSLARWGEMSMEGASTVRISNGVYDLHLCEGKSVPVLRSPMHGFQAVSSPQSQSTASGYPLNPSASPNTMGSIAVHPAMNSHTAAPMGDAELEEMQRILHWADNSEESTSMLVAATITAHDVHSPAFTATHYQKLGHRDAEVSQFIPLGVIVDV